jgi:hypothetical protein
VCLRKQLNFWGSAVCLTFGCGDGRDQMADEESSDQSSPGTCQ